MSTMSNETKPEAPSQGKSLGSFQLYCLVRESLVLLGRRSSDASSSWCDFSSEVPVTMANHNIA